MDRTCRPHEGEEEYIQGFAEREMPLGKYRCRWHDNIKMNLKEIELGGMD
jgi:hypothetical protein